MPVMQREPEIVYTPKTEYHSRTYQSDSDFESAIDQLDKALHPVSYALRRRWRESRRLSEQRRAAEQQRREDEQFRRRVHEERVKSDLEFLIHQWDLYQQSKFDLPPALLSLEAQAEFQGFKPFLTGQNLSRSPGGKHLLGSRTACAPWPTLG
jgi:hypothetical protein